MSEIGERTVYTPSQLARLARATLEDVFPLLWIEGEISNFRPAASGHWYFSLKDAQAEVRVAMFRSRNLYVKVKPSNGLKVLLRGRVTLYEAKSEFQIVAEHLEEAGIGALMRAFAELKAKLEAEGLFASARKRRLPQWPRRLAVVTSPQGAALRDVLSVLSRRFPLLAVEVFPVLVQGSEAAAQIRAALDAIATAHAGRFDLVLLTRGGGSMEDLWAFNDEALARRIAGMPIPVVSAVGHEIDTTIADFVADLRAPTPSAAAELITPDRSELTRRLAQLGERLAAAAGRAVETRGQRLDQLRRLLDAHAPLRRLALLRERLESRRRRSIEQVRQRLDRARLVLAALAARLQRLDPRRRLELWRTRLLPLALTLRQAATLHLERRHRTLMALGRALHLLSPYAVLDRGYALILDPLTGGTVRSAAEARRCARLRLRFADGTVEAVPQSDDPARTADAPAG